MPGDSEATATLGWALYARVYQEAQRQLEKRPQRIAVAFDAMQVTAEYHLALAHLKLGERRRRFETLSVATPESQFARSARGSSHTQMEF
jgi:diacylglycerol kinase family enzyme